jgi:hypothetical protein
VSVSVTVSGREVSKRWPHIRRFLRVEQSGWVEDEFYWWWRIEHMLSPAEQAAGNEEWADFYEFRLEQRAEELAGDDHQRGLVEEWTDDMAYCLRRCAAYARGENPGEPVPLSVRRPDLYAAKRARVDKIIADVDARREPSGAPVRQLRKAG